MNEWTLIQRLQQGDEAAFRELVGSWQDMVYNTALGIVQQPEDAEDIAQEVFAQSWQSIRSFKGESKLSTWLYRITISKSMDHLRRGKRKKRFAFVRSLFGKGVEPEIHPPDFHHPGVALDNKEGAAILFRAIQQLPDNQRIAFTLNKLEGLNHQEIGEVMGTTVSAVESLLHRAKTNLRKTLEDFYRETG
ncbi:MAG: RNA polymerase sigma factor [Bacteroidetes bacterium]|nr:RNA polymerase sigma factor [Bacteroidota bacterium]